MPARGELSGQGSLCNTLWLPEVNLPLSAFRIVQRSYQCLYCGQTFQCPKERRVHIASVHSNSKTEVDTSSVGCTKCGLQVTSPKQLKEHIKLIHKRADRSCGVCGQTFADKRTYEEHLSKVHPLECTVCGKTFHSKAGLVLHTKIHMAVKPHPCDACDKSFVTAQKLREHQNTHTGFAPLQCNMCDRKFKRYSNLKQHKDIAHFKLKKKTKDFFCECGETFQSKKKLAWHQETHLEKPKQCPYCSERYIHSASLTRHIRKAHDNRYLPSEDGTKAKNVQCPVCNLVFLESSLRAHMRQHTPQPKQYGCIICGKRFHTKWNLHLHRWTHASRLSKPFKCTMCKGAFIRLTDLQAHVRAHYGQKPFTCNHCGMQFNRKNNWHRHEKEHTSMKKYTCEECGKTFHRNYYLVEHSRIHTGVKPYSCHICNKTSATKSNHNKHLRTHHARETVNTEG
ncbi:hypothetical protein AAG570_002709 [Ranatra chinensis]|uniref:C2H2-type domain-containing protein n=1 Tax=Ranatra chinensis TaxID=642074 RepID=A0ABD0Y8E9_9HEMI